MGDSGTLSSGRKAHKSYRLHKLNYGLVTPVHGVCFSNRKWDLSLQNPMTIGAACLQSSTKNSTEAAVALSVESDLTCFEYVSTVFWPFGGFKKMSSKQSSFTLTSWGSLKNETLAEVSSSSVDQGSKLQDDLWLHGSLCPMVIRNRVMVGVIESLPLGFVLFKICRVADIDSKSSRLQGLEFWREVGKFYRNPRHLTEDQNYKFYWQDLTCFKV
ncbi:hypothetical protein TNCV_4170681 [Trichonephila clavipes]|nr:hypothetical protein TNCV_4170681 [Trichonephila clavipes]